MHLTQLDSNVITPLPYWIFVAIYKVRSMHGEGGGGAGGLV